MLSGALTDPLQIFEVVCTREGHPFPDRRYALKVMFAYGAEKSAIIALFEAEYNVFGVLPPHPLIVKLFHQFRAAVPDTIVPHLPEVAREYAVRGEETQFVVFSFHDSTLKAMVADHKKAGRYVEWDAVRKWSVQLCASLCHITQHCVLHLDIKLDNLLLSLARGKDDTTASWNLLLADFGCALRVAPSFEVRLADLRNRAGNTAHLSPEFHTASLRAGEHARDATVRMLSQPAFELGCVLHELCTLGDDPLGGYPASCVKDGEVTYDVSDIAPLPDVYPTYFGDIVRGLLCCNPVERLSIRDAMALLEDCCGALDVAACAHVPDRLDRMRVLTAELEEVHLACSRAGDDAARQLGEAIHAGRWLPAAEMVSRRAIATRSAYVCVPSRVMIVTRSSD